MAAAPHPKTVSSLLPQFVAQALRRRGIGAEEFQRRTGIAETLLNDRQARVPVAGHYAAMALLWQQPIGREVLDVDLQTSLQPWPALAALLANAPTLASAMQNFLDYRELIGEADQLGVQRDGDDWLIEYRLDEGPARSAACAYFPLAMLAQLFALYLPGQHRVRALELAGESFMPLHQLRDRHGAVLSCGHRTNRLVVHAPGATAPSAQHNPFLYRYFEQQAQTERQRLHARQSWAERVALWIVEALAEVDTADAVSAADGRALLAQACAHLAVTPRALQRRLQAEDTSFLALLAQARAQEARRLLHQPSLSLTEIGERLGFSAPSAFTRFFAQRHGMSPSRYRDQHRMAVPAGH